MKLSCLSLPALAALAWFFAGGAVAQEQPAALIVDGPPILRDWVQPEYPAEAAKARREGVVWVEFIVEADGNVSRAAVQGDRDDGFDAAALAAVQKWKFKPGIDHAELAAYAMQVEVPFLRAQLAQKERPIFPPSQRYMPFAQAGSPAKPQRGIEPEYPAELEASMLPGSVEMEFDVNAEGKVDRAKVLWATHPAFVEVSLRAIQRAVFTPARQGPLPRRSLVKYPVAFWSLGAKPAGMLAANGLTFVADAPPILPEPRMLIRAVYPRERLLAGEEGSGVVEFTIDEQGQPREIALVSADQPEFGAALRAAVETWGFKPAQGATSAVPVRMRATHVFTAAAAPAEARLAGLLRPGGAGIAGPKGLDAPLQPLWRGFPVYPQELRARPVAGEATIEFVIDREGRARVPRIVSASEPVFGWAAATTVTQWAFARPTRGGEPADVLVRVPVKFTPPGK